MIIMKNTVKSSILAFIVLFLTSGLVHAQSTPDLDITLNWLVENYENDHYEHGIITEFSVSPSDRCTVNFDLTAKRKLSSFDSRTVNLRDIDPESIQYRSKTNCGSGYVLSMRTYDMKKSIIHDRDADGRMAPVNESFVTFCHGWKSENHAEKVIKAMKLAVNLCQGRGPSNNELMEEWLKNSE